MADPKAGVAHLSKIWINNNLGNFSTPYYDPIWESAAQLARDEETMKCLMLGNNSSTRVNCAILLKNKKFSPWASYDFTNSEMGSFKGTANVRLSKQGDGRGADFSSINSAGSSTLATISLPLWPKYYLKEIYNPDFIYKKNPLRIGDGIPIVNNTASKGKIKVTMKYVVGNDDLSVSTTPSQNIYISFKKTNFNDTADNYYENEEGRNLKDFLWEPNTSDTTYKVEIPIDAESDMWLRIGPKERNASGLYAQISNLDVEFINEY